VLTLLAAVASAHQDPPPVETVDLSSSVLDGAARPGLGLSVEVRGLPVARDVASVAALAPGAQRPGRGLVLGSGARDEIEWRLDGLLVSDPVTGGFGPRRAGPRLPAVRGLPGPAFVR
jgi:hypothetical protein